MKYKHLLVITSAFMLIIIVLTFAFDSFYNSFTNLELEDSYSIIVEEKFDTNGILFINNQYSIAIVTNNRHGTVITRVLKIGDEIRKYENSDTLFVYRDNELKAWFNISNFDK